MIDFEEAAVLRIGPPITCKCMFTCLPFVITE